MGLDAEDELGSAAGIFEQAATVATARPAVPARWSNRRRLSPGPVGRWAEMRPCRSRYVMPAFNSLQLRNHLGGKPFHLLAVFGHTRADGVQQDHLGARVETSRTPRTTSSGVPETGTASMPGMSP